MNYAECIAVERIEVAVRLFTPEGKPAWRRFTCAQDGDAVDRKLRALESRGCEIVETRTRPAPPTRRGIA